MASLLSTYSGETAKVAMYIKHCEDDLGIKVLPPDINTGESMFVPLKDKAIVYGLSAVKAVGVEVVNSLVLERRRNGKFKSLTDFIERMVGIANRQTLESLIKAGAFDFTGNTRSQLVAILDETLDEANKYRKTIKDGQLMIFMPPRPISDDVPEIEEYPSKILLTAEKEALGIYLSGHPLQIIRRYAENNSTIKASDLMDTDEENDENEEEKTLIYEGKKISLVCIVAEVKEITTKNKKQMAFVRVEDLTGETEVTMFPDLWEIRKDMIKEDAIIQVDGKISMYNGKTSIAASSVKEIEIRKTRRLYINTECKAHFDKAVSIIESNSGDILVYIVKDNISVLLSRNLWTNEQGVRTLEREGFTTILREE